MVRDRIKCVVATASRTALRCRLALAYRLLPLLFLAFLLTGCDSKLIADGQSLSQANEIVATLGTYGLSASTVKEGGARSKFSVYVSGDDYMQAATILHEKGLPRDTKSAFQELTEPRGLMPNSREIEALRADYALGITLEEALTNLQGVLSARVVVRAASSGSKDDPSVSVVIRERQGSTVDRKEIESLISNSFPGIRSERIDIVVKNVGPDQLSIGNLGSYQSAGRVITVPLVPFLFAYRVAGNDYLGLAVALLLGLVCIGCAGVFVGYWVARLRSAEQVERQERRSEIRDAQLDTNTGKLTKLPLPDRNNRPSSGV